VKKLPTGLANTWNQALICQFAETNPADTKLAIDRTRPATELTTIFAPGRKLRRAFRLCYFAFACHGIIVPVNPTVEMEKNAVNRLSCTRWNLGRLEGQAEHLQHHQTLFV
jgi:hypothetical protein